MSETDADGKPLWEQPGEFRRDCDPDRASTLTLLTAIGVLLALAGVAFFLPALVALALFAVVFHLAEKDLTRMRAGTMDPQGRRGTARAQGFALAGVAFSLFALVCGCCSPFNPVWQVVRVLR